ncbi:MAG: hypothetical protein GXY33_07925 [Phycisphaerae bacterium]|nr:hypothetical protein [Phycisphaerae bacterium]
MGDVPDLNWGIDFPRIRLPSIRDLERLRALRTERPEAKPDTLLRLAMEEDLLRDLAECFHPDVDHPDERTVRRVRVVDLAAVAARFADTARALGFSDPAQPAAPELRLWSCRIDSDAPVTRLPVPLCCRSCLWGTPARLTGAAIDGPVQFIGVRFLASAEFANATFADRVRFAHCIFHGPADFANCRFNAELTFDNTQFHHILDLAGTNLQSDLDLRNAAFAAKAFLNLSDLQFGNTKLFGGRLRLTFAQLRRRHGLIVGDSPSSVQTLAERVQASLPEPPATRWQRLVFRLNLKRMARAAARDQYAELAANFEAQRTVDARQSRDLCLYRYRDLRRRTQIRRLSPRRWLWEWLILKWAFGYGLRPVRIAATALIVILAFALAYHTGLGLPADRWAIQTTDPFPVSLAAVEPWPVRLQETLHISAATFIGLGTPTWQPMLAAKIATTLEAALGLVLTLLFALAAFRRFTQ